jgi:hypothetical protein
MNHLSETAKLRNAWASNASQTMLDAVKAITKRAKFITGLALGASTPHQILYLVALCIPHMNLSTEVATVDLLQNYASALGMVIVAVAVPIGADIAIYSCIDTLGAQAATRGSKIRSLGFMIIPLGASGFVNFLAPAPMLLKGLSAFLVVLILISQGLRFIETDWDKLQRFETDNTVVIEEILDEAPAKPRRRVVSDRERRQRDKDLYDAMTSYEQYKWRREWDAREARKIVKREVEAVNPVSAVPAALSAE